MSTGGQIVRPNAQVQSWVQGGLFRVSTTAFVSEERSERPILVVTIHGDAPFHEPDYHYVFAAKLAASHRDVVAVGLLRPGYTDPEGHTSDGERGEAVGDNFHITNTDAIADVIGELKRRWNARKVVVAAHSGGGTLAANILGRHPTLIDQALLVSSVFDVEKWRQYMFEQTGEPAFQGEIETLSPIDQIAEMLDRVEVTLMVGSQDEIAPLCFSEQYETAARKFGKNVKLVCLEGEGHEIFLKPAVIAELEPMLR
jgi:pimeloyl-ACP methyl ester carboxylesterase